MTPGYQATQAIHASLQFALEHPQIYHEWITVSNYLGFLSVKNEEQLQELVLKCQSKGIKVSVFTEPDINNQITAIAIEPCDEARRLVSSIPRAMREFDDHKVLINKHSYNEGTSIGL